MIGGRRRKNWYSNTGKGSDNTIVGIGEYGSHTVILKTTGTLLSTKAHPGHKYHSFFGVFPQSKQNPINRDNTHEERVELGQHFGGARFVCQVVF